MNSISPIRPNESIENIINKTIEEGIITFLESVQEKEIIEGCNLEKQKEILKDIIDEVVRNGDATFKNISSIIYLIMNKKEIKKYDVQEIKKGIISIFNLLDEKCDINRLLEDSDSNKTKLFISFILNMKVEKVLQEYYWFFIGNLLDRSTFNENDNRVFIMKIVNRIIREIVGDRKITEEDYKGLIGFVNSTVYERIDRLNQYSLAIKRPDKKYFNKTIEKIMMVDFPMKFEEMTVAMNKSMRELGFNQDKILNALLKEYKIGDIDDVLSITNEESINSNRRKNFINGVREPTYEMLLREFIRINIEKSKNEFINEMKDIDLTEENIIENAKNRFGVKEIPKEWIRKGELERFFSYIRLKKITAQQAVRTMYSKNEAIDTIKFSDLSSGEEIKIPPHWIYYLKKDIIMPKLKSYLVESSPEEALKKIKEETGISIGENVLKNLRPISGR